MNSKAPFIVLAMVLMLFANFGLWLSRTVYNPQNFSDLVVETLKEDDVRNAIASEVVDNSLETRPLIKQILDDPISSAISGILGSQTFESVLQRVAERFQVYLVTENREDVTIEVGQLTSLIKSAGTAIAPELGSQIPDVQSQTITLVESDSVPKVNKWLKPIVTLSPIAGLISLIILAYLFYKSDRRIMLAKKVSLYFFFGIVLFSLLIPYSRTLLQGNISDQNAQVIATAAYDAFVDILSTQLLVLIVIFGFSYLGIYIWERRKSREIYINKEGEKEKE